VSELNLQRRPFQFSLRKLMLWTAVWAIYLGFVRWVKMPLPLALILTIYLAGLVVLRIKWGYERGLQIAYLTSLGIGLLLGLVIGVLERIPEDSYAILPLLGLLLGFVGFHLVHFAMRAVDWIDSLMETKTPRCRSRCERV